MGILGNANLFLMNPNGIVFGVGAKLDVKGSFFGTTATSINFADGVEFTSRGGVTPHLLSVTVPVGLGFGNNPAAITVQGTGSQFKQQPLGTVLERDSNSTGLQVNGSTLALIGGNIALQGGVLEARNGKIELGSVTQGKVGLNISPQGLAIDYTNAKNLGDITLSQTSLIDASGNPGGSIQLQGRNISLQDNSVVLIQNQGNQSAGNIKVQASESLTLKNSLPIGTLENLINIQNLGSEKSGDIEISTNKLVIEDGGRIGTENFASGRGGNIQVNAYKSIELNGTSPFDVASKVSSIGTISSFGGAKSGNITITTGQLTANNSGGITIATLGGAGGGDITINASDIDLIGQKPLTTAGSFLSNSTFFGGNAGNLTVNTARLRLLDGGFISTVTHGKGNAGNLEINASKSIEINGIGITSPSRITASGEILPLVLQQIFRQSAKSSGMSGTITINTPNLTITKGGTVTVNNKGTGDAGSLKISADSIRLDNKASISAATASGNGGNIYLQASNLQLTRNSNITATATGSGSNSNGGNINLDVDALAQLNNSNITADAVQGKGGSININTQGLFASGDSKITASSERGINGIVNVTSPDIKQDGSLQEQASNFISAEQVVANSCLASRNTQNGKFVITGNGGVPETPNNTNIGYTVTQIQLATDNQKISLEEKTGTHPWKLGDNITEAQELHITSSGRIVLTATTDKNNLLKSQNLTCH